MNPILLFETWYNEELALTEARIPSACCLSTTGLDGFPNARFVSLKEIIKDAFVITGPLNSRKGLEMERSRKAAITFWWTETERQVRVQGIPTKIPENLADKYFAERASDSQIVSIVSEQGKELDSIEYLNEKFCHTEREFAGKLIKRPQDWGGYFIKPVRIEFLEFKPTRFHKRVLYEMIKDEWTVKQIQP